MTFCVVSEPTAVISVPAGTVPVGGSATAAPAAPQTAMPTARLTPSASLLVKRIDVPLPEVVPFRFVAEAGDDRPEGACVRPVGASNDLDPNASSALPRVHDLCLRFGIAGRARPARIRIGRLIVLAAGHRVVDPDRGAVARRVCVSFIWGTGAVRLGLAYDF